MKFVYNTKSPLGVLSSSRLVTISDNTYAKLAKAYTDAVAAKSTAKADAARKQLLAKCFREVIPQNKMVSLDKPLVGKALPASDASARMQLQITSTSLQVTADVVDKGFTANCPEDAPWLASSVELWISPSGLDKDASHFVIGPADGQKEARVWSEESRNRSRAKAWWKRTDTGYKLTIQVPWSKLHAYKPGWNAMPLSAAVNYPLPGGKERQQSILTSSGSPWWDVKAYGVLKTK